MDANLYVERLLDDEGVTSPLSDPAASYLMEKLIAAVEHRLHKEGVTQAQADQWVAQVRQAGRVTAQVTAYLCEENNLPGAKQLYQSMGAARGWDQITAQCYNATDSSYDSNKTIDEVLSALLASSKEGLSS